MAAPTSSDDEIAQSFLSEFEDILLDPPDMRPICEQCKRPAPVCWCGSLPRPPVDVRTTLIILQHPFEEKRCLRTAPMLLHGLQPGRCHIIKGKKFNLERYPLLKSAAANPHTLLLFPGSAAVDISDIPTPAAGDPPHTLILLDGTWSQARGIYKHNKFLHGIQQVQLRVSQLSEYVIRTQPMDGCLSTVETAAMALAQLEQRPEVKEALLGPLRTLCQFQLQHGAVTHHSKEYLVTNGLYVKQKHKEADPS